MTKNDKQTGVSFNAATNESLIFDLSENELAQRQLDEAEAKTQAEAKAAREVARQEVLDRLGLSAAEVQLLLGA